MKLHQRTARQRVRSQQFAPLSAVRMALVSSLAVLCSTACGPQRGTVGAKFGRDGDGHLFVREAPAGLGASSAGMKVGDEVILIDGRDVRPLTEQELHAILSGERGSSVRFTVLRGDGVERLAVERTVPPQPQAAAKAQP